MGPGPGFGPLLNLIKVEPERSASLAKRNLALMHPSVERVYFYLQELRTLRGRHQLRDGNIF